MIITNIRGLYGLWDEQTTAARGAQMANIPALEDAFLVVKNGVVMDYGLMSALSSEETSGHATVQDAGGGYVIPAFCDSHTHLVYAAERQAEWCDRLQGLSYEEIARRGGGILNSAEKMRNAAENELYDTAKERIEGIISTGTGAVEIKSGYGLSLQSELKMLRVIARLKESCPLAIRATLLAAHAIPVEFKGDGDGYVRHIIEVILPAAAAEGLADYIDSFCDEGFFSVEQTQRLLDAAARYNIRGKIHANELAPSGGVELGCANDCLSVDHLERMNESAYNALVQHPQTIATALPQASLFLGIPYTPLREMIDRGLAVALASDYNPGSAPSGNMQLVGSLGCIGSKILPTEALTASTLNSAAAMGVAELGYGAIRRGQKANIAITKPMDGIASLYYNFGENSIRSVILNK